MYVNSVLCVCQMFEDLCQKYFAQLPSEAFGLDDNRVGSVLAYFVGATESENVYVHTRTFLEQMELGVSGDNSEG